MRNTSLLCALLGFGLVVGCTTERVIVTAPPSDDPASDETGTGDENGAAPSDDANGGGTGGGSTATAPPPDHLVSGLGVAEVAVFQAVKVSVVKNGARVSHDTPIVANRDALVRVYVKPDAGWTSKSVSAQLRLLSSTGTVLSTLNDKKTISTTSTDAAIASTFNFTVAPENLPAGVKYAVALTDAAAPSTAVGTKSTARWPQDGTEEPLGTASSGRALRVKIVPVQYMADGSGRLPDTSAAQIERYRKVMYALYPAASVEITVRAPYQYTSTIAGNGSGWSTLLQRLVNLRQQDNVDDDVYYWGAFEAASSFSSFCNNACVTGLSSVLDDPRDSFGRASIGVGYTGDDSAYTMAHELGHAHGRNHAPCGGANGVDPSYPHAGAAIGTWGYDINARALIDPSDATDIMGYCHPQWISDYTYSALFDRIQYVNGAKSLTTIARYDAPQTYRVVDVAADGTLSFASSVQLTSVPFAEAHDVTYEAADGTPVANGTAHFYKYDHLAGGFLVVPEQATPYARIAVKNIGTQPVTRVSTP